MKKKSLLIIPSALLMLGSLAACGKTNQNQISNQTVSVQKQELKVEVSGTGTIQPTTKQDITPSASGTIKTIYVKEGQSVKKGDPLIALTGQDISDQISHQKIALEKLNLQLSQLNQTLADETSNRTVKAPAAGKIIAVNVQPGDSTQQGFLAFTMQDVDGNREDIKTKISGSVADVYANVGTLVNKNDPLAILNTNGQTENQINSLELDIKDQNQTIASLESQSDPTIIRADIDGTITNLTATAGESAQTNTVLGSVYNDNQMELTANIDELDIPKISVGQKTEVSVDAFPNKTFNGEVTSIATAGVSTNGVSTFAVNIALDNKDGVRPGMSASANIVVADKMNTLTVPIEAVHERNGKEFVAIEDTQNKMQSLSVEVGLHNDTDMEILSGLTEGQKVVLPVNNTSNSSAQKGLFGGGGFGGGMNRSYRNSNSSSGSNSNGLNTSSSTNSSSKTGTSTQSSRSNGGN